MWGPDDPGRLVGDGLHVWVAGQFSVYRIDVSSRRIVRTVRLFRRERRGGRTERVPIGFLGMTLHQRSLWLANLAEGATYLYRFDARTGTLELRRPADTEIVGLASGAGTVWAISHDRGTLLRVAPRTGSFRRIDLRGEPHGLTFGAASVWVAMYHAGTILRFDAKRPGATVKAVRVPFPPEPLAAAGRRLWAIPSPGGHLADKRLRTVVAIDAASGRIVHTVRLRGEPRAIVARQGEAWVATARPNELARIAG